MPQCQPGVAAVTCFSGLMANGQVANPNGFVFAIMDLRDPAGNGAPAAPANWLTPATTAYHDPTWIASVMGEVFGVDFGEGANPDIFVGANSLPYVRGNVLGYSPGAGGNGGDVYRINGTTGAVTRIASLPNHTYTGTIPTGPVSYFVGLGQVSWNDDNDVLYVSNLDDGKIYVLTGTGTQLGTFDHGASLAVPINDDPNLLQTQLSRMVFGLEWNTFENRLYYALRNGSGANEVWSVGVNGDGTINGASKNLEYTDASPHGLPSDIQFSTDGSRMLIAEMSLFQPSLTVATSVQGAFRSERSRLPLVARIIPSSTT